MRRFTKLYRGLSFLNILKALFILTWLIILWCSVPVSSDGQLYRYPVSFLNDRARDITGAAAVNAPEFVVPGGLTGEGQIVAVADSGLDAGSMDDIHPDLRSAPGKMPKIVLLKSWAGRGVPDDPNGHGTHMAATIAGTGAASNGKFRGIAPGASIYFQAILDREGNPAPPANLADLFLPAYSAGARVHVNGWGGGPDTYLEPASQTDDFMRGHPDFLAIFGAGNSGPAAGTLTGEANSKNALAVGASTLPRPAFVPGEGDTTAPAEFSSRGPAGDGRIKPELLAPASAVISARSRLVEGNLPGYQNYTRLQGTSMAAAVAGGSAALVREYFKKYMDMATPSAALVKAALVNGTRPAEGGPSRDGFGTIDLAGTIIALKESTFSLADEWAGVSQGGEITYTYHVSDPAAPFKATLAWTDPPAGPGSAKTLLNDLDLKVRTPDGRVYYGNHFLGANTPDKTNNVEQVYLPSPVPGDYTVTISGTNVRRNTVQGSSSLRQDFALVWGQKPAEGMVKNLVGGTVGLTDGSSFNITDTPVVNLVNNGIEHADEEHLLPGARVYRSPQKAYITSRIWHAIGVRALKMADGTVVFTEGNPVDRTGGYSLSPECGEIMLNYSMSSPDHVPAGVEIISALINPVDQTIRHIRAGYTEIEGVISNVQNERGLKTVFLAGNREKYQILPGAVFSYEDTYVNTEAADAPFGTGALDEFEETLPGMPVRLHLAPSNGGIQYLAMKRKVALGTVREVNADGGISLENGFICRIFPGAYVKRDRADSSLEDIKPGDHITAVLLPGTGEAVGLVAFSSVFYGKAIDFTNQNRTIYMLDDNGRYFSLHLPDDAVVYRWGLRSTTDAITSGSRIRVTTDPEGEDVWQLDIADTLFNEGLLRGYDKNTGIITAAGDKQYRISGATRFFKNGCRVTPGDLLPGEYIELEYAVAPPPTGNVLISVNAATAAQAPLLLASAVPLQNRLVITGRTDPGTAVHVWEGNSSSLAPVDEAGKFSFIINGENEDWLNLSLVAVNLKNGGVSGVQLSAGSGGRDEYESPVAEAFSGVMEISGADYYSPVSRAEAAAVLARLLSWPRSSEKALTFSDAAEIPAVFSPAVAEASARNIFKGYTDGSFQPASGITRAEAAVVLSTVLNELGVENSTHSSLPFWDASEIPTWAVRAVAETTAAGIFEDRAGDIFAPGDLVTCAELADLLDRLLTACESRLEGLQ